jgi:two-component system NtrC family response regulator
MDLLLIDNPSPDLERWTHLFEKVGFCVTQADRGSQALEYLLHGGFDLILGNHWTKGLNGLELLEKVAALPHPPPVILMSERPNTSTIVHAMQRGASHYLEKPLDQEEVSQALREVLGKRFPGPFPDQPPPSPLPDPAPEIVGISTCIRNVKQLIRASGRTSSPVFIQGPTGTGKELIARAIHRHSERASGPFVPVNCGALPEGLAESELFGAVKGAFTGATSERTGLIRAAEGGTLFLDELGEMPLGLQVHLLRVLQEKAVRRIGDIQEHPVNVRFLAATNRDPEEAVRQGKLREDLYYRLVVLKITLSSLSERPEDILPLTETFLGVLRERYQGGPQRFTASALEAMRRYSWPGNVRELQNVLDLLFALGFDGQTIDLSDLPEKIRRVNPEGSPALPRPAPPEPPREEGPMLALRDAELEMIKRALEKSGGNKAQAARMLGISRQALYRRLADLDVEAS